MQSRDQTTIINHLEMSPRVKFVAVRDSRSTVTNYPLRLLYFSSCKRVGHNTIVWMLHLTSDTIPIFLL